MILDRLGQGEQRLRRSSFVLAGKSLIDFSGPPRPSPERARAGGRRPEVADRHLLATSYRAAVPAQRQRRAGGGPRRSREIGFPLWLVGKRILGMFRAVEAHEVVGPARTSGRAAQLEEKPDGHCHRQRDGEQGGDCCCTPTPQRGCARRSDPDDDLGGRRSGRGMRGSLEGHGDESRLQHRVPMGMPEDGNSCEEALELLFCEEEAEERRWYRRPGVRNGSAGHPMGMVCKIMNFSTSSSERSPKRYAPICSLKWPRFLADLGHGQPFPPPAACGGGANRSVVPTHRQDDREAVRQLHPGADEKMLQAGTGAWAACGARTARR